MSAPRLGRPPGAKEVLAAATKQVHAGAATIEDPAGRQAYLTRIPEHRRILELVSVTTLTFASQSVGTTSAAQGVTLTNGGSAALTINSMQIGGTDPGDFAMPSDTCGSSLAVNASCTVNVTFTPTSCWEPHGHVDFYGQRHE